METRQSTTRTDDNQIAISCLKCKPAQPAQPPLLQTMWQHPLEEMYAVRK